MLKKESDYGRFVMNTKRKALLIHGFLGNSYVMQLLALRLRTSGYTVVFYDYPMYPSMEDLTTNFLKKVEEEKPYAVIGHSLGGVMIAKQLRPLDDLGVKVAVCLGSPLSRCILAEIITKSPIGFLVSDAVKQMLIPKTEIHEGNIRLGMIAGKNSGLFLKLLFPYLRGNGDGLVRLKETDHEKLTHRIELNADHLTLISPALVYEQLEYFISLGRFSPWLEEQNG